MSPFRLRACAALLTAPITGPSRCGHMDNAEEALPTCPQPQQQQTAYQNQPKPPTRLRDERNSVMLHHATAERQIGFAILHAVRNLLIITGGAEFQICKSRSLENIS